MVSWSVRVQGDVDIIGFSRRGTDWSLVRASKLGQQQVKKKMLQHAIVGPKKKKYISHLCECLCTHIYCYFLCVCKPTYSCIQAIIFEVSLQSKHLHRFFHCSVKNTHKD